MWKMFHFSWENIYKWYWWFMWKVCFNFAQSAKLHFQSCVPFYTLNSNVWILFVVYPHQCLVLSFLNLANSVGAKWYLSVFNCTSLITNYIKILLKSVFGFSLIFYEMFFQVYFTHVEAYWFHYCIIRILCKFFKTHVWYMNCECILPVCGCFSFL